MTTAFTPPMPPFARYSGVGRIMPSDYYTYFKAMSRNPLEVWGEEHFNLPIAPFRFLGRSSILINDPDAIHHCFVANAQNYRMNPVRQSVLQPFLRNGLLTAEGEVWKTARHAVAPVFTPRKVNAFAPQILTVCEAEVSRLKGLENPVISVRDMMIELTLDVLMETLFSGDEALDKQRFTENICELIEISGIPHPFDLLQWPGWLPRFGRGRSERVIQALRDQVIELAALRRAQPTAREAGRPEDFLDLLLSAGLDDTAVVDNLLTFLAAGHETTARTLAWTLYLLSQSPSVRDQLEYELGSADLDPANPSAWIEALPFTEAVLKESLRLYPSAPILARQSIASDLITGVAIPPKTDVLVSTWLLHRQRGLWQQPDDFRPERFLGPEADGISRTCYLPFGIGPRVCIGARFAMMEMIIVMASLLREFRFDFAGERHPLPVMKITLQPDVDIPMSVSRRARETV